MTNRRRNARLDCNKKAQIEYAGSSYPATVTNLAIADTQVHLCMVFNGAVPAINIGDECLLYLFDEQHPSLYKYDASAIRVGQNDLVVCITGMRMHP